VIGKVGESESGGRKKINISCLDSLRTEKWIFVCIGDSGSSSDARTQDAGDVFRQRTNRLYAGFIDLTARNGHSTQDDGKKERFYSANHGSFRLTLFEKICTCIATDIVECFVSCVSLLAVDD